MIMLNVTEDKKKNTITARSIYTQELVKILKAVPETKLITYEKLGETIGMGIRAHENGYSYQKSARAILERENNIVFEVEKNIGLRRLTPEEVALGTGNVYLQGKKSLLKRSKCRIKTIDDHYDELSSAAKLSVTMHRTILAFDNELSKPKNILKIKEKVKEKNQIIGFQETMKLFEK